MSNKAAGWLLLILIWLGVFGYCLHQAAASVDRSRARDEAVDEFEQKYRELRKINRKIDTILSKKTSSRIDKALLWEEISVAQSHQKKTEERVNKLEPVLVDLAKQELQFRTRAIALAIPLTLSLIGVAVLVVVRWLRRRV